MFTKRLMAVAVLGACLSAGCGKKAGGDEVSGASNPAPASPQQPTPEPKAEPKTEPKDVAVGEPVNGMRDVWSAYFENPAVAEEKYGGKWVEQRVVFQTMKRGTKDPSRWVGYFDMPRIQTTSPGGSNPIRNYGRHVCQFVKDTDVSTLSARNLAVIRGKVKAWEDNMLVMENCVVVPKK